jgi:type II secretory pathway pseudopilin PulG
MTPSPGIAASRQRGFSIVEILIGFFVLSIAFASLGAYTSSQRTGLFKSSRLSDGTQAAVSALEEMKRDLSDSAKFANLYEQAGHGSVPISKSRSVNNVLYKIELTVTRGPEPDYLLKVRAQAAWKGSHSVELGVLVPGQAATL